MGWASYKVGFRVWLPNDESAVSSIHLETWYTGLETVAADRRRITDWAQEELLEMLDHDSLGLDEEHCWQVVGEAILSQSGPDGFGEIDTDCSFKTTEVQKIPVQQFDKLFSQEAVSLPKQIRVELQLAWQWACPECGRRNYVDMVLGELSPAEAEEAYRIENELEDWQEMPEGWKGGEYLGAPANVTCRKCRKSFRTINNDPSKD